MFFKGKYPGGNLDASKEKGSKEKETLTSSEKMLATSLKSLIASREKHLPRGFLLPAKVRNVRRLGLNNQIDPKCLVPEARSC
jgi:hypothetical protein